MTEKNDIQLPPMAKPQVPIVDADIDIMDIKRLAAWCERTAKEYARLAVEHDRHRRSINSEDEAIAELERIGATYGYGWSQQQLGILWDDKHDCAPRGSMGVTVKDHDRKQRGEPTGYAEQALQKIHSIVTAYLPPDGLDRKEAMSRIVEALDPPRHPHDFVRSASEDGLDLEVDDYVRCITCDYVGLVRAGEDECPACGEEALQDEPKPDDQVDGPVGIIRADDQPDGEPWAEIWATLPVGAYLYAGPVAAQPNVPDTVYLGCARMGLAGASDEEVLSYVRMVTKQDQDAPTPPAQENES